ncbi:hypothetical protein DXG03_004453 [Asterophora parasitica]|uniref:Uncharacterized protein n=1 Tax=Asterophora parasitica TaxID=117018 RepID=A0A9P7G047_9AGAR|nr:hypothetical protein DXG03_004453 [Asterophora parasitica]
MDDNMYLITIDTSAPQVLLSASGLARNAGLDSVERNDRTVPVFVPKLDSLPTTSGGWLFALQPRVGSMKKFGFVKLCGGSQSVTCAAADDTGDEIDAVLGLKDWVDEMEQEGRPGVFESAVDALLAVFNQMMEKKGYQPMEMQDAQALRKPIQSLPTTTTCTFTSRPFFSLQPF